MDLSYLSLEQYAALPSQPDNYLIDRFLPCPGRVLLVGPPKRGKSYLALQIGLAVAKGESFLGRPALSVGRRVLYLQFDTPHSLWLERMQMLKEEGIELPPFRPQADCGDFIVLDPTHLRRSLDVVNNPDDVAYLIQIMTDLHPAMVIVDTLAKLHSGDENDAGAMKKIFHVLNSIFADCCILYVHHTRKLSPQPGQKVLHRPTPSDAARGSSFLAGEVDAIWLLYNNALTTEVRFDESGSYHCTQNPHSKLWVFDESTRVLRLEQQARAFWQMQSWPSWVAFRHYLTDHLPHVPDHLIHRLRRELEPSIARSLSATAPGPSGEVAPSVPQSPDATTLPGTVPSPDVA